MGLKIKSAPGAKSVKGMPPELDTRVTVEAEPYTYPLELLPLQDRPDFIVDRQYEAYSTTGEVGIKLTGSPPGLKVELLPGADPSKPDIVGARLTPDLHVQAVSQPFHRARVQTDYGTREYSFQSNPSGRLESYLTHKSFTPKPGTLAAEVIGNVKYYLPAAGASNETSHQFLDGGNFGVGNVVAQDNPNFTFKDIDWSGISVTRTGSGYGLPFMLVSPRHAVFAGHVDESTVGDQVVFRRPDGSTQTVTVLARVETPVFGPSSNEDPDLAVVYFDQPVTGCSIFKIPPPDWDLYLPSMRPWDTRGSSGNMPLIPMIVRCANSGEGETGPSGRQVLTWNSPKFLVSMAEQSLKGSQYKRLIFREAIPKDPQFDAHWRSMYGGDSSSPFFMLVRENVSSPPTPVLVSTLHAITLGIAFGPFFGDYHEWLQGQMDAMCTANGDTTTYQLQTVNLSRFKKFSESDISAGTRIAR